MKILVIRGGGIGDFIVTLPVFRTLREQWPEAHIELLGQPSIAQIALKRYYLDAIRSADHGPFARFFAKDADLDFEWINYFRSFDLVVSYFFDPDEIFKNNLIRCGLTPCEKVTVSDDEFPKKHWLLTCDPRISSKPAARQLCEPLLSIGLSVNRYSSSLFPQETDLQEARKLLPQNAEKMVVLHPGSGSPKKNWILSNWLELAEKIQNVGLTPIIIGGEADQPQLDTFAKTHPHLTIIRQQPLPTVAAIIKTAGFYIGHDTGISHMAAAVGAKCILLFSSTDPEIWSPPALDGIVIKANENFTNLTVDTLLNECETHFKQA